MRRAIGALIGALVFALLTFLSLLGGPAKWNIISNLIWIWSLPGALIGYVFAAEKRLQNILKRKGPLIGAYIFGGSNLFFTISIISTGGEGTLLIMLYNAPIWGIYKLTFLYDSLDILSFIFILLVVILWCTIGAAIVALIQKILD